MDNYLVSYFDPRIKTRFAEYACAKELLLMYFRENRMNYYANPKDDGCFQLYYRLKNTRLSIQQCIYVKGLKYLCRTTIAEVKPKSHGAFTRLQALVNQINHSIDIGKFVVDTKVSEVHFFDGIRIKPEFGATNLKALYNHFDRLVSWPQYLIDVEYGEDFLDEI